MIFGPMPLDDALGAVAGHTLRLGEGGVVMKGSVLDERQIARRTPRCARARWSPR